MPTSTVLMRNKFPDPPKGFTLLEVVMVLFIVSLVISIATISYTSVYPKIQFREKINTLVGIFEMAAISADQSDRRYAVLIDFFDHSYALYDVNTSNPYNRENLLEEDIITSGFFDDYHELVYVQFDDSADIIDGGEAGTALFVVGHNGWNYGGKVVVRDNEENLHSLVVSRFNKRVKLYQGDAMLAEPEFDLSF